MKMKKIFATVMAAALALTAAAVPVQPADAAGLKGITGDYSFTTAEDNGWTEVSFWGADTASVSAKDLTASFDVYLPASSLASVKTDGGFGVAGVISVTDEASKKTYNVPFCSIDFTGTAAGKNIAVWHYDDATQAETNDPSYASVKKAGDFYKISARDVPIDTSQSVSVWDETTSSDSTSTLSAVPSSGIVGVLVSLHSWNLSKKVSGKYFVTNASVKSAGTQVFKADTSSKENIGTVNNNNLTEGKDVKFSTLASATSMLTVAKTKATVAAGKSVKIKTTPAFSGDKVTVKTSKKAVATAKYKNGKLTVKGVKQGKATITLTCNGVSKKVKITVK